MVSLSAIHAVTIELHGGMLTLATACILIIIAATLYKKAFGKKTNRFNHFFERASQYAEPTAYLAAIGGVIGLILSFISGYYLSVGTYNTPAEALTNSPITMNKIMVSMVALEIWLAFIVIRSKFGEKLWENKRLAVTYMLIGLVGFAFTILSGSMGGHMTGKGSILDPILEFTGVSYNNPWVVNIDLAYSLLILLNITIVAVCIRLFCSRRAKLKLA